MNSTGFSKGDILVPDVEDFTAWSVIACDQYTSQPQYWHEVETLVKTKPSTLNMIVPEINLNSEDLDQHIAAVNRAMRTYLRRHIFHEVHDYIYTRRTLSNGKVRHGLIGVVDLEQYEFHPGSKTTVRATEGVIHNRIEPRLTIREVAPLEVSHSMLLIDDRENTVFSFLEQELDHAVMRVSGTTPCVSASARYRSSARSRESSETMRAASSGCCSNLLQIPHAVGRELHAAVDLHGLARQQVQRREAAARVDAARRVFGVDRDEHRLLRALPLEQQVLVLDRH